MNQTESPFKGVFFEGSCEGVPYEGSMMLGAYMTRIGFWGMFK